MRRPSVAVVLTVVAAVLAGCAGIPTSGPVERVEDESGLGESTVRYTPAGPAPGATEAQIVRGFLDAMLAYPVSHRVAAEFLTPDAAQRWRPGQGTTVYTEAAIFSGAVGTGRIDLDTDVWLDEQGRLTPADGSRRVEVDLARVDGQWRIATPPDGVLVSRDWFDDYVRAFDLYFLDPGGRHLVPVPVHEVVGDQLATSLMTGLAIGPRGDSTPGLTTAVPSTEELRASVPVVGGVAQIDFSTRVGELSTATQKRISAQVAWTLRQVPAVTDIQITGDGTVVAPTGDAVQDAGGWASFGPDKSRRWAIVVAEGVVQQVGPRTREPLPGEWGQDDRGAQMVTAGDDRVAGVWRDRARVTTAVGTDPDEITGDRFVRPVVDIDGAAWLVDRSADRARVRVHEGDDFREVSSPGLPVVSSFAVSPDGARYAATARGRLLVGGVERVDGRVVGLTPPRRLATEAAARQVVWIDGSRVAHLGPPGTQLRSVRIDGTGAVDAWPGGGQLLPDIEPVGLVATPAARSDLYLLDSEGGVWVLDRTRWVPVDVPVARGIA
ncbi:lipoprotein LpqB [Aeromicrobium flavum]|uniref:Lipoprotein LpqB n=1 Tax=Aeromicrobium flavum TaxID=416568 RepID=A0A512HW76_9ACTN|nr:LpqB family beta-propeller domain-containing protein [Aeromicrobium flavum]GEO89685.1 lipoprotein LpqB [Aeromicrobium flavum]